MKIKLLLFIVLASVSGCSHLNTQFQCPMEPTVHCKSLDQINRMVLAGQLGRMRPIPMVRKETVIITKRHYL